MRPSRTHRIRVKKTRHFFFVDNHNVGTCSVCGEVRQYPAYKREPVLVLRPGSPPACRLASKPMRRRAPT